MKKTEKIRIFSNSYGIEVVNEDKTEPAVSDPAHLDLSSQRIKRVPTRFGCAIRLKRRTCRDKCAFVRTERRLCHYDAQGYAGGAGLDESCYGDDGEGRRESINKDTAAAAIRNCFRPLYHYNDASYVPDVPSLESRVRRRGPNTTPKPSGKVATFDVKMESPALRRRIRQLYLICRRFR